MSMDADIVAEIGKLLTARLGKPVDISPETNIVRDLGLDSLAVMDFVFDVEDAFDLSIPQDRIAEVETVEDLAKAITVLRKDAA